MLAAPTPIDELSRRATLRGLNVLDTEPEIEFDALAKAAAMVCGVPISLISLVDADRQWFKANYGLPGIRETHRNASFCAHAILGTEILEVPDTLLDHRFADNPAVTESPNVRFYAGAPLTTSNGARIGTLCVMGNEPRQLTSAQRDILMQLAHAAVEALEHRRMALAQAASETRCKLVIEGTDAGTWEWNVLTGQLHVNDVWAGLMGYRDNELPAPTVDIWHDRIHPADREESNAQLSAHLAGATELYDCDLRIRHRHGHWVWVHVRGRVLSKTLDGRPEWMFGTMLDISARKQQEVALRNSEQLLNQTGEVAGVGGWEVVIATGEITLSDQTCRIYGFPPGYRPQLGEAISYYALEAQATISHAVQRAVEFGEAWDLELPFTKGDGQHIWVRTVGHIERGDDFRPVRLFGALQDITERVHQHRLLTEQHKLLHITLNSIADAVITTDARAMITWLNPVAERLTGWSCTDAVGRYIDTVFKTRVDSPMLALRSPVQRCLQEQNVIEPGDATVLVSRHGDEYGIHESVAPIRDSQGVACGVVLVFRDVSEQRRTASELRYRATHDALTGLVNRSEFEQRLAQLIEAATDTTTHSLLYIDLDQFKLVNDACGHTVGDELLRQVGQRLRSVIRATDTLARLGGDEFAVLLTGCHPLQSEQIAQKICDQMEDFRFTHDGRQFRIGTSIGLVTVDARWPSVSAVMQAADAACDAAKEAGRNRVHIWLDSDSAMHARRGEVQWATRLEEALDRDQFMLFAQRIEPVRGRSVGIYAEVLLRMQGDDGKLVPPSTFLPAAERFHLAPRIDRWVLRNTIARLRALPSLNHIDTVCVNLSGQSIGDRAFHRQALDKLIAAGSAICHRLCLEITETAVVTNMGDALDFVTAVRALGVRVALDDFGAGASSFGYLQSLPVDVLKIDGQYVRALIDNPLNEAAVRCFVDVARVAGLRTVAEFVDSPAVLRRIDELGIDYAQGYLLHHPEQFEQVFEEIGIKAA